MPACEGAKPYMAVAPVQRDIVAAPRATRGGSEPGPAYRRQPTLPPPPSRACALLEWCEGCYPGLGRSTGSTECSVGSRRGPAKRRGLCPTHGWVAPQVMPACEGAKPYMAVAPVQRDIVAAPRATRGGSEPGPAYRRQPTLPPPPSRACALLEWCEGCYPGLGRSTGSTECSVGSRRGPAKRRGLCLTHGWVAPQVMPACEGAKPYMAVAPVQRDIVAAPRATRGGSEPGSAYRRQLTLPPLSGRARAPPK
jgi:hypothetical protein